MALETSTYINGLVATNPTSTDNVGDGDNHIRLLKSTIKSTFPNITGAVTSTHSAIDSGIALANTATNANTASSIVKRDASGNFSAGVITAGLTGDVTGDLTGDVAGDVYAQNGTSVVLQNGTDGTDATFSGKLATARAIALTGDVTGTANFDGSADISITATVADDSHNHTIANIDGLQDALDTKTTQANAILGAHPVGSIYTSTVATNPGDIFGGTWAAFGAGKVLVGLDANDTSFDTVEETGGAKTHTLTVGEIPSHTHTFTAMQDTNNSVNRSGGGDLGAPASSTTAATGGGAAHNNLQPYIVVYMFKRTA